MTAQQINLHIEELHLYGFAPQDRSLIAQAIQRELTRLLATEQAQGLPQYCSNKETRVGTDDIGKQVAHAIYGRIKRR